MSESSRNFFSQVEVVEYYERTSEETRLENRYYRLEFERTKEILERILPKPPAVIVDVGGAAGAYAAWLAQKGYTVHLSDLSPRLVEEACRCNATLSVPIESISVADARSLPYQDEMADVVLLLGPLYHLTLESDRHRALREAFRVSVKKGVVVAAACSRYSSTLGGLSRKLSLDPEFARIRNRDLKDGQHRNDSQNPKYFTTAYFHLPSGLEAELKHAGFADVKVLGVEGPGWLFTDTDFEERWADPAQRKDMMDVARLLESDQSIMAISAHLFGIGRKSDNG